MLIAVIGSVDRTDRNFDEVIACFAEPLLDSPLFTEATTSLYEEESSRVSGHKPNQQPVIFLFFFRNIVVQQIPLSKTSQEWKSNL